MAGIVGIIVAIGLIANLVLHRPSITYAGTFVATGAMSIARDGATATLLADGLVLIAGGSADSTGALGSAELYDPSTGAFMQTGSLATPRANASAVVLTDGRVLVAGGTGSDASHAPAVLSLAELYDPKTGTFTSTGPMTMARVNGTVTVLADGRVLVAGGSNHRDRLELASAELYDPKTGLFASTGSMITEREGGAATLLPDGRVLIAGGVVSINANTAGDTATAELYDPVTGTFSATGSMAAALEWRSATLLITGRILVAGGRGAPDHLDGSPAAEVYDPATGLFGPTGSMRTPRVRAGAIVLVDGRVLVTGGLGPAELYDAIRGTFIQTGTMLQPRNEGTSTLLADGRVLVAGGTVGITPMSSAELFR